jgi:dolichol kinase
LFPDRDEILRVTCERMPLEIPMQIYLAAFGCIYVAIAFKIRSLPGKTGRDFANELINAGMWFVGVLVYPLSYSPTINPDVENYFYLFSDVAMAGIFLVIVVIVGRQKTLMSHDPEFIKRKDFEVFAEKFSTEYNLRQDIDRKAFHVLIPVFVLAMYVLGSAMVSFLAIDFVSGHDLGIFFIINCGFGGLFLFAAADVVRLSYFFKEKGLSIFHLLPTTVLNILTKRMHKRELYTFIPTVLILQSFIPFLPAPFSVFATVTLIASLSDAMASIVGKASSQKYPGRFIIPSSRYKYYKHKTVPGYVAGFLATFGITLSMLIAFPVAGASVVSLIIAPALAACTFVILDILSLPVNDNILNPVLCGLVMLACLLLV